MTRSNSIPTHDASMELYGASPQGSTLSLAERPRSMGMVRSGSFRDRESNDEGELPDLVFLFFVHHYFLSVHKYSCLLVYFVYFDNNSPVHGSVLSLASNASSNYSSVSVSSTYTEVHTLPIGVCGVFVDRGMEG